MKTAAAATFLLTFLGATSSEASNLYDAPGPGYREQAARFSPSTKRGTFIFGPVLLTVVRPVNISERPFDQPIRLFDARPKPAQNAPSEEQRKR